MGDQPKGDHLALILTLLPLFFAMGLVGAMGTVVLAFIVLALRPRPDTIGPLAVALGFDERKEGTGFADRILSGTWRGMPVQVRFWTRSIGKATVSTTTVRLTGVASELAIAHQGLLVDLFGGGGPDLLLGDPTFDPRLVLGGPERCLRGRLDAETRGGLVALDRGGSVKVHEGVLEVNRTGYLVRLEDMRRLLDDMANLAERLEPRPVTDDALLAVVGSDPLPEVRLRTALHLLEGADAPLRRRIIEALGRELPAAAALADAISGEVRAIEATPRAGLEEIAAMAPVELCRLLERAGAEATLIGLLSNENNSVRVAAAQSLGAMGTVRAVEPLLPLSEGFQPNGAVKRASREAIAAIQGRLGPVSAGSLSVAEDSAEAGGLSVAVRAGALSTPTG